MLKTMAVEIVALRDKIESRASTPAEELRFTRLVEEMKGMVVAKESQESGPEFRELIDREKEKLKEFFGEEIEVPPLPSEITPKRYEEWKEKGLELHYLPPVEMKEDSDFPGWEKKPGKRHTPHAQWGIEFFDAIKNGDLPADAATLSGAWTLIDTRRKPQYNSANQRYEDDPLGPVLEALRKKNFIADFKVKGSRYDISPEEFEKPEVRAALAEALGIPVEALHLPRAIDYNYIGNAFYPEWGETDTYEWFEDVYKGQHRLYGGDSDGGGLSHVSWIGAASRYASIGFRPLGRFSH